MDDGIFGKDDSEAEILRLERPATRSNWMTPDGTAFDLTIPPTVYPPREDTDLLCQTLRGLGPGKGQRLLEIGCGSGAVSLYAASLGYRVRACDINPYAVAATKANAQHLRHDLDVHEGGPGPRSDGSVEQWSGTQPHDVVVWNLPYLNHDPTVEEVLGPLEEAALLDTDDKGLVSRLMTQVSENQLISKNGIILLLVSGNERGLDAEQEAQKNGFAARCVSKHAFEEGDGLRTIAIWNPYTSASTHRFESLASTNQSALEQSRSVGDLFTALQQTSGRGRRGRAWSSEKSCFAGTWTLALGPPTMSPGLMQILAGHAVIATHRILGVNESSMALKWPNDVIQAAQGNTGKVAGVLVEGRSKGEQSKIVVGIGVNFASEQSAEPSYPIAHLLDAVPKMKIEHYERVIHAIIASYFEHHPKVKATSQEDHLAVLMDELIRSQELLGKPFYRNEQWFIEGLDVQGSLVLGNHRQETVVIPDGEDLQWPVFMVD
jgi:biotin-[acetyl-CoA-carboxylase] ligase BirA-like protein